MASSAALELILQLRDEASAQLQNVSASLSGVSNVAAGTVVAGLTAATGAAAAFAASSVGVAADFNSQMARVGAVSGASAEQIDQLRQTAIEMGSATVFSSSEAAAALFELAAGGMNADQSMAALPGTLALAAAGGVELASAAEITAATLNGFGLAADQATAVADKLSVIGNISAAGVMDLGASMKYVAPVAASMGMSIDDVGAGLAVLANNGIKGSDAGTALRAIMLGLAAPSSEAAKAINSLGIEVFDAEGKMKSLPAIIAEFNAATGDLTDQQRAAAISTIVGREASGSMLAMMAAGEDTLAGYSEQLANSAGAAENMATQSQTAFDLMKGNLGGTVEQIQIALGTLLIPTLVALGNAFANTAAQLLPVIAFLGELATTAAEAGLFSTEFAEHLSLIHPALQPIWLGISQLVGMLMQFGAGLASAGDVAVNWQMVMGAVGGLLVALLAPAIATAAGALAGLVVAAAPVIAIFGVAMAVGALLAGAWQSNFGNIQGTVTAAMTAVQSVIMAVLGVVLTFWQANGAQIMAFAAATWTQVQMIIGNVVAIIATIISTVFGGIAQFISAHGTEIQAILNLAWAQIQNTVQLTLDVIQGITTTALGILQGDWQKAGEGINQIVDGIRTYVEGGFDAIIGFLGDLGGRAAEAGAAFIENMKDGVLGAIDGLIASAKEALGGLADMLPGSEPKDRSSPLFGLGKRGAALVENFQRGIDGAALDLRPLLDGGISQIAATSQLRAIPAPVGNSNTSNTSININMPVNAEGNSNGKEIAKEIEKTVKRAVEESLRRTGRETQIRVRTG